MACWSRSVVEDKAYTVKWWLGINSNFESVVGQARRHRVYEIWFISVSSGAQWRLGKHQRWIWSLMGWCRESGVLVKWTKQRLRPILCQRLDSDRRLWRSQALPSEGLWSCPFVSSFVRWRLVLSPEDACPPSLCRPQLSWIGMTTGIPVLNSLTLMTHVIER